MNVTRMRTLLRKRGPLAFPVVAGYFALHYAQRHKAKTAAILLLGAGGIFLFTYGAGLTTETTEIPCDCVIAAGLEASKDAEYDVTDLGTLGGKFSQASALNNRGQVAGLSLTAQDEAHGYVWRGGKMTDVGTLGGEFSLVTGLNNNGAAVGFSVDKSDDYVHAFAWRDGKMSRVFPKSEIASIAMDINDSGAIVGLSLDAKDRVRGFLRNGDKTNFFYYGGSDFTVASAVNASGAIAGFGMKDCVMKSFTLSEGKFRSLPGLRGEDCFAQAINERGDVAGASFLDDSDTVHAVVWRDGKPIDLGVLPGLPDSGAYSVNRAGVVVGAAFAPQEESVPEVSRPSSPAPPRHSFSYLLGLKNPCQNFILDKFSKMETAMSILMATELLETQWDMNKNEIPHAFVWRDGKITDLNQLLPSGSGWLLAVATGVNDRGDISGVGLHNGKVRGFLLSYRK